MDPRYLTKSRFKLARECPTKLFYTKKKQYYDSKLDDEFLKALAEGGFQVGELAKLYYPGGINIETLDYQESLAQTTELMKQENVTIYEAAFLFKNLFIRADIVVKRGDEIELIEVKAKSFDPALDSFTGKKGGIVSEWKPYIEDIAFQKYVLQNAHPGLKVNASLLLTDKTKLATVDGLNQMFLLYKNNGRNNCRYTGPADLTALGDKLLTAFNIDNEIELVLNGKYPETFLELIDNLSYKYKADEKIVFPIGGQCSKCEFKTDSLGDDLLSGFNECWLANDINAEDLKQPLVLELWNFRKKDDMIKEGKYFLKDINDEDVAPKTTKKQTGTPLPGLTSLERQLLQIKKVKEGDNSSFINKRDLKNEMETWVFPLHFIDFETTAVAIPFNKGRRPYEQIAFQFSHHIVREDGTIAHEGEWISTEPGKFPNFDFLRALKKELETDKGTIFRYSNHENTILNFIYRQLQESNENDKNELGEFIKQITKSSGSLDEEWLGNRSMVDLLELVKKYYYEPLTRGSNSIKQVLPAVLATSTFLQEKYVKSIYGNTIKSKNFTDQAWLTYDEYGNLMNPYKLLPPVHEEIDNETIDLLVIDEETGIADGGAAMIAFARMQFTEMGEEERDRIRKALLRYCELDTLAMVMIYEAWVEWCKD